VEKIKKILRSRLFIISAIILVVILAVLTFRNGNDSPYDFIVVDKRDVVQGVSVTGRVEPAEEVDLSFNVSGKIVSTPFAVGDQVRSGEVLMRLDQKDASNEIIDAEIDLEDAKLSLEKLRREKTNNLVTREQAKANLDKSYEEAFNLLSSFYAEVPTSVDNLEDTFKTQNNETEGNIDYYAKIVKVYYPLSSRAGKYYDNSYNNKRNELKKIFNNYWEISRASERSLLDDLLGKTYELAKSTAEFIRESRDITQLYRQILTDQSLTSTKIAVATTDSQLSELSTLSSTLEEHLISLFSFEQTIKDQKENIIDIDLDIKEAELAVKKKENDLRAAHNNFSDRFVTAPFDGVVVEVVGKVSASVASNQKVISLISLSLYEIKANVPEADITKVKVGDKASLTLDAFGQDTVFEAEVSSIEPAATIIDGVATYKTTLVFLQPDQRIKTGMTADIDVSGERAEKVLAVPARAIIREGGEQFVRVLKGTDRVEEVKVETGLRGSDGYVEVKSGLSEEEKVVTFSR
jgi:RND family efflux transporter MFP subunit